MVAVNLLLYGYLHGCRGIKMIQGYGSGWIQLFGELDNDLAFCKLRTPHWMQRTSNCVRSMDMRPHGWKRSSQLRAWDGVEHFIRP